jgi:hypothetical protein
MEQTPLQIVSEILLQAKEDIAMVLTDTTHQNILLSVTSNLTRLANQTAHLGGITIKQVTPVDFPPVTNFMGEPIIRPKKSRKQTWSQKNQKWKSSRPKSRSFTIHGTALRMKAS